MRWRVRVRVRKAVKMRDFNSNINLANTMNDIKIFNARVSGVQPLAETKLLGA